GGCIGLCGVADGDGIGVQRHAAIADGGAVVTQRRGATAEGRRPVAHGQTGRSNRRAVVTERLCVVAAVAIAVGGEVVVGGAGGLFELGHVDGIGGFGAGGDVGDLAGVGLVHHAGSVGPVVAGAHRDGVGAVGQRLGAQRDAVLGILGNPGIGAEDRGIHGLGVAVVAHDRGPVFGGPGLGTDGRGVVGIGDAVRVPAGQGAHADDGAVV